MSAHDDALDALRKARVVLFEACQKRDWLLKQKPVKLNLVDDANEIIETARADVQTARDAVIDSMGE